MATTWKNKIAAISIAVLLAIGLYLLIDRLVDKFDLFVGYGLGTHGSKPYVYFFGLRLPFDYYYRIWRAWQFTLGLFSLGVSFISVDFLRKRLNA